MPSGNWSFPCSPRNPAKVREELRLLASLIPAWRARDLPWSPRSGTQLEFGRRLRMMAEAQSVSPALHTPQRQSDDGATVFPQSADERSDGDPGQLVFQRQAGALSDDNLRWTARARFGTYKFFGLTATDAAGFPYLTPAGEQFACGPRPADTLLRQLLKWQYPDNQHRGSRWPAEDFAIHPFIATSRLILELGGLSRQELSLFCFTMRRTEDAGATAEAIRHFRRKRDAAFGRTGKATAAQGALAASQARYEAEGRRVVLGSTNDYADALIRYFRYTGLFSVRGARIVVATGREGELEELVYEGRTFIPRGPTGNGALGWAIPAARPPGTGEPADAAGVSAEGQVGHSVQLALGEAPPIRLAEPWPLFGDYDDAEAFYAYYGAAVIPKLPWEDQVRLSLLARALDQQVSTLRVHETQLRTGRIVLSGSALDSGLPEDYDELVAIVDRLRREKFRIENAIFALESRTPERLREAIDFFGAIAAREVIDPPTYLEWNTWRTFLALGGARQIVPHLALDEDLQPLSPAQGNQPDLEVDYGSFLVIAEVTLRTGADQRQAEARPVTRHVLEAQRRYNDPLAGRPPRPVYGLFLTTRIHADTANDFFVALKYRVIERHQIAAIPLTLRQFAAALRPFTDHLTFEPDHLRRLLEACVDAGLRAETGDEWLEGIDAALRRWLAQLGAPHVIPDPAVKAIPLPLF